MAVGKQSNCTCQKQKLRKKTQSNSQTLIPFVVLSIVHILETNSHAPSLCLATHPLVASN